MLDSCSKNLEIEWFDPIQFLFSGAISSRQGGPRIYRPEILNDMCGFLPLHVTRPCCRATRSICRSAQAGDDSVDFRQYPQRFLPPPRRTLLPPDWRGGVRPGRRRRKLEEGSRRCALRLETDAHGSPPRRTTRVHL